MKLTEEEVIDIMYEDGVYHEEEDIWIYEVIDKTVIYTDTEKGSVEYSVTIKENKTGKLFQADLGESPWCEQDEHNASQEWKEVKPKTKKVTTYE